MADTDAPGLNRPMSQPVKLNVSRFCTVNTRFSPKETSDPVERPDARAATSVIGKLRSARVFRISRPTAPVAPTTATLYDIGRSPVGIGKRARLAANRARGKDAGVALQAGLGSPACEATANLSGGARPDRSADVIDQQPQHVYTSSVHVECERHGPTG